MRSLVGLLLMSCCLLLVSLPAQAQTERTAGQGRKGSISGRVTDSSGGVLKSARIVLEPEGLTVVSDVQGEFFVNDLDPGSHTLTITYIGFAAITKTVEVVAAQTVNVEAKLQVQSQSLEVLVTADRPSAEAEAVNRERSADNIMADSSVLNTN